MSSEQVKRGSADGDPFEVSVTNTWHTLFWYYTGTLGQYLKEVVQTHSERR